eukprot:CAMPEP_0181293068 /NCGR_PEP_ID=MMETSP1101-20121128/2861_1 /TAXON_ID=46948 /ORGANISM="Rhodomonas abbreviata, Strain Caron Lab Isolate" /LENGTH=674 /DNA_ID=CAMNT_0023397617 /DNA_START=97 /DNA_END=2121 /DNA_ORIENTATION=+
MPQRKNALDDIIDDRLLRQSRKTTKQLYADLASKHSKKVSDLEEFQHRQRYDFSHIPGRPKAKENLRAIALRKKQEEEAAAKQESAHLDWTTTDEFGNLELTVETQVLELSGVPDKSAARSDGPVYPRGKELESLNLDGELLFANSTTFKILEPKRRADYDPDEAKRFMKGRGKGTGPKDYELVEPEHDMVFVNPHTGKIHERFLNINCVGLSEDDTFKIGRGMELSDDVELLDLSGNFILDASGAYMIERINDGLSQGHNRLLHTLSLANNTLGGRCSHALQNTLALTKSLTALNLSNLFDPMSDEDGTELMRGMLDNKTIRHIDLSGNLLGKSFCWELKLAMVKHPRLETIRLECNDIPDDGAYFIGAALKSNPASQVRSIYLGWNKVDHVALGALIDACAEPHCKLQLLNLQNNRISRASSGQVVDSLARTTCLTNLCLSHNRLADMSEIGLGMYYNRSVKNLDVSHNRLADDAFAWFAAWGKDRKVLQLSNLARFDVRGNKLADLAAKQIIVGLGRRSANRVLTSMETADNLIDPLLEKAIQALLNPFRPFVINKREAKRFANSKRRQDLDYWKERDWEAIQKKRQAALDQAVRLLNTRTDDQVELDGIVGAPLVSKVPLVKDLAVAATQWNSGVKPLWKLQKELILEQKKKAARDIAMRKSLVKGFDRK